MSGGLVLKVYPTLVGAKKSGVAQPKLGRVRERPKWRSLFI